MMGNINELLAGMSESERRAAILEMMQSPEYAAVRKDTAAVKAAEKAAELARHEQLAEARKVAGAALQSAVSGVLHSDKGALLAQARKAELVGFSVQVTADGFTFTPQIKAVRSGSGSAGSASPSSTRSLLNATPEELFNKYATQEEKDYYASISGYAKGGPAWRFRRMVYVPQAIADGTIPVDESEENRRLRRYPTDAAKEWAENGTEGIFEGDKTFAKVADLAAIEKAEKKAK